MLCFVKFDRFFIYKGGEKEIIRMNSELEGALSDDEEYDSYFMMFVIKLVVLYDYSY